MSWRSWWRWRADRVLRRYGYVPVRSVITGTVDYKRNEQPFIHLTLPGGRRLSGWVDNRISRHLVKAPAWLPDTVSAEQHARDMLDRLDVEDAQSYSSGDLVELANQDLVDHARVRGEPDTTLPNRRQLAAHPRRVVDQSPSSTDDRSASDGRLHKAQRYRRKEPTMSKHSRCDISMDAD